MRDPVVNGFDHFDYEGTMSRRAEIVRAATGIDYDLLERTPLSFDYEALMDHSGGSLEDAARVQAACGITPTPLIELLNLSTLSRSLAPRGKGCRVFLKDEARNPAGSFKDRRASLALHHAAQAGYKGVIAATSGNYGAAVASQAARHRLACIILQEASDSRGTGQPEILEKGRACEAYGAEVWQLSVGPELFALFLQLLAETRFFSASLYTPLAIRGIETLGWELAHQSLDLVGRFPDAVLITHAGGGNVTGTARGLMKAGAADTMVVAVSVDIEGLHMASDTHFNRKSVTTGHTGFGIPFAVWPDRADVPRNAARALRYMDRYVTVSQGEVFYITEALAQLEGMERGPAGNTSLAAAFSIAQEMDQDQILVVQETEYTGAGKHPSSQLSFAKANGVSVARGDPAGSIHGTSILIPEHPGQVRAVDLDIDRLRKSYIRKALESCREKAPGYKLDLGDELFLAEETKSSLDFARRAVCEIQDAMRREGGIA